MYCIKATNYMLCRYLLSPTAATCISLCSCLSKPEVGYALQVHDLSTGKEVIWNGQYKMLAEASVLDGAVDPSLAAVLARATVGTAATASAMAPMTKAGPQAAAGSAGGKVIPAAAAGAASKAAASGIGVAAVAGASVAAGSGTATQLLQLQQNPPVPKAQALIHGLMLNAGKYLVSMQLRSGSCNVKPPLGTAHRPTEEQNHGTGAVGQDVPLCWQLQVLSSSDEKVRQLHSMSSTASYYVTRIATM